MNALFPARMPPHITKKNACHRSLSVTKKFALPSLHSGSTECCKQSIIEVGRSQTKKSPLLRDAPTFLLGMLIVCCLGWRPGLRKKVPIKRRREKTTRCVAPHAKFLAKYQDSIATVSVSPARGHALRAPYFRSFSARTIASARLSMRRSDNLLPSSGEPRNTPHRARTRLTNRYSRPRSSARA